MDQQRSTEQYPQLRVDRFVRHTPLLYWLAGGLKSWYLLPRFFYPLAMKIEAAVALLMLKACSFVDVVLVRLT